MDSEKPIVLTKEESTKLYNDLYNHPGFKYFLEQCLSMTRIYDISLTRNRQLDTHSRNYIFGLKDAYTSIYSMFESASRKQEKINKEKKEEN